MMDEGKRELRVSLAVRFEMRMMLRTLMAGAWLAMCAASLMAQNAPPPADANPFPEDAEKAPAAKQQTQPAKQPQSTNGPGTTGQGSAGPGSAGQDKPLGAGRSGDDANPFPGEDPNAPIIPVDGAATPVGERRNGETARPDPDGDPVRSPDGDGNVVQDDGFSSSQSGLKPDLEESSTEKRPGSSAKTKTRAEVLKEDLDVGSFYLSKKDWKGAQGRFADAFRLDGENPDAVWGLAEAERHLQLFAQASEHYNLFLSYDPDGPHSREARKGLREVMAAQPSAGAILPK
jgi:tetratricopeptide (TPR) repeat protein